MLESKCEFKKLQAKDINWILKHAGDFTSKKSLKEAFKYVNISFALRIDNVLQSIVMMIIGENKHYIVLLWTNGSYKAIKEIGIYFRDLAKNTTLLFHSQNAIAHNHRHIVSGAVSGKNYYEAVV